MQTHYRLGDILANSITHGVGAVLALVGATYLIVVSTGGSAWIVVSCSIFAATLVLVYLCSTLYHSLVRTRARHVFHVLDHSAIYLLIAGTYTPFTLVSLRGPVGWTLFGIVWTLAIVGTFSGDLIVADLATGDEIREPYSFRDRIRYVGLATVAALLTLRLCRQSRQEI